MTYYHQQIQTIKATCLPDDELCAQIIAAKNYMDKHFAEHIDLDKIANRAFYSKFHFLRLFKTLYGVTPHQYLTSVRINKAKQLLRTNISTAETCIAVGFESVSSFKELFKRYTSFTPSSYQHMKHKEKIVEMISE